MSEVVTSGVAGVSSSSLERIREALGDGRLHAPLTHAELVALGEREQLDVLVATLGGHSRAACLAVLNAVMAERHKYDLPGPELVWTGPEGLQASARDTAVVLRWLFHGATSRVVLAGYSFRDAKDVLGPLYDSMRARHVTARFFVEVAQPASRKLNPETYGQRVLSLFVKDNWPFGAPYPEIYCDRRSLTPGPPWSSLHAKCVSVDGQRAFVSSANFTHRGQERNIEAGVLLHDSAFASQLERQWLSLIEAGLLLRWSGDGGRV